MRREGRAWGAGKDSGGAAQTHETKGTWLGAKKANEKTEYGYKRAARAKSEAGRIGRRWRREQLPKQNLF